LFFTLRSFDLIGPVALFLLLNFAFIISSYALLRFLHISPHWVAWSIGSLLIFLSVVNALLVFAPYPSLYTFRGDIIYGAFSLGVAVYAASQWITRQGYLLLKRRAWSVLVRGARQAFLFLRAHHQLFGWVVLATATVHGLSYIFLIGRVSPNALISGIILWLILLVSISLGLLIEYAIKRKRLARRARWLHSVLALVFFVAFLAHA
jgi:hypothetical protein